MLFSAECGLCFSSSHDEYVHLCLQEWHFMCYFWVYSILHFFMSVTWLAVSYFTRSESPGRFVSWKGKCAQVSVSLAWDVVQQLCRVLLGSCLAGSVWKSWLADYQLLRCSYGLTGLGTQHTRPDDPDQALGVTKTLNLTVKHAVLVSQRVNWV